MTIYQAALPPTISSETVEALRELGEVRFTFVVNSEDLDGASRAAVVRALAEEYAWRGLTAEFWDRTLSGRRARGVLGTEGAA